MVQAVHLRDVEDGVLAQHAALDDGRERRGDDDAREDRLIEVADDLLDGERDRGDGSVEGRGDAGGRAHGDESTEGLRGHPRDAAEEAGDARADLDGGSLATERGPGAELEGADDELAQGVAQAQASTAHREGDLHLRDTAATRVGDDVLEQDAARERAEGRGDQCPADPRSTGSAHGLVDEHVRRERDAHVKRDGREAADDADDDGEEEEALGLGGGEADLGAEEVETPQSHREAQASREGLSPTERSLEGDLGSLGLRTVVQCAASVRPGRRKFHASPRMGGRESRGSRATSAERVR